MMITRKRLWFFLWNLFLSFAAVTYGRVLRGLPWRTAVAVVAGQVLASAAVTALFSVRPRTACYASSAVFGAAGIVILVRGFDASLSQTIEGILVSAWALTTLRFAGLSQWP
jgi:hypothetical protein